MLNVKPTKNQTHPFIAKKALKEGVYTTFAFLLRHYNLSCKKRAESSKVFPPSQRTDDLKVFWTLLQATHESFFQVHAVLESWESRCQDTVSLVTPSTPPVAWNPLENVKWPLLTRHDFCFKMILFFSALKIHVSNDTKQVLDKFSTFELETRGNIEVKVTKKF